MGTYSPYWRVLSTTCDNGGVHRLKDESLLGILISVSNGVILVLVCVVSHLCFIGTFHLDLKGIFVSFRRRRNSAASILVVLLETSNSAPEFDTTICRPIERDATLGFIHVDSIQGC